MGFCFKTNYVLLRYISMVINTTPTSTDFKIIPRNYSFSGVNTVTFTNEDNKVTQSFDQTPTKENGYFVYDISSGTFTSNQRYDVKIEDTSNNVLWRGNVFVTNQTTQNYSIYG